MRYHICEKCLEDFLPNNEKGSSDSMCSSCATEFMKKELAWEIARNISRKELGNLDAALDFAKSLKEQAKK